MEVSSTPPGHRPRRRSLPGIGVAAVRSASLSERGFAPVGRLFPGELDGPAGGLQLLAALSGPRPADPPRTSHRYAAGLSRRWHRRRPERLLCKPLARSRLPRDFHHDTSRADPFAPGLASLASDAPALVRRSGPWRLASRHDSLDGWLSLLRTRHAPAVGAGAIPSMTQERRMAKK